MSTARRRRAATLLSAILLLMHAAPGAAQPDPARGWTEPVVVARTRAGLRPAAVVGAAGDLHLLWVTMEGDVAVLVHGRFKARGVPIGAPRAVARGVDPHSGPPAAARVRETIYVVWAETRASQYRPVLGALADDGRMLGAALPLGPLADSRPVVAIAASDDVVVAWTRPRASGSEVVVARAAPAARGVTETLVVPGDFPTLAAGADALWLAWWDVAPSARAELRALALDRRGRPRAEPRVVVEDVLISGRFAAPAAAVDPGGTLHLAYELAIGGIVSTRRLFYARAGPQGTFGPRMIAAASPAATSPALAATREGQMRALWSDGRPRRTPNHELYEGRFGEGEDGFMEERVTYTLPGSLEPVLVALPGGRFGAVWLEVRDIASYDLVVATTGSPRRRTFLWGIPELDLSRPAGAGVHLLSAALAASVPATVHAAVLLLATAAGYLLLRLVLGQFRFWQRHVTTPGGGLALVLALYLLLKVAYGGVVAADSPAGAATLFVPPILAVALVAGAARLRRVPLGADMARLALFVLFALLDVLLTVTPAAALRLSRL